MNYGPDHTFKTRSDLLGDSESDEGFDRTINN